MCGEWLLFSGRLINGSDGAHSSPGVFNGVSLSERVYSSFGVHVCSRSAGSLNVH